ncbi:MAG TPA: T9SS type A sorting domain-containing protein, partial [Agriterribacter sp.]|nr:T9SS type A sorting domain-containing protein [Agriterribacter sp.]
SSVTVDGSVKSTYPSGSTFLWRKLYGPDAGKIVSPTSLKTAITGLSIAGDYQFQLRITDKDGNLSGSSMHVIVKSATSARTMAGTDENAVQDQPLQLAVPDISSVSTELDAKVNPNPVQSDMTIWINGESKGKTSVTIYNLSGQVLLQQEFVKDAPGVVSKTFNVSKLAPGTYIAQIIVDNKYKKVIKILKQ